MATKKGKGEGSQPPKPVPIQAKAAVNPVTGPAASTPTPATPAPTSLTAAAVLGVHPQAPNIFGAISTSVDGHTTSQVPHRQIIENTGGRAATVAALRPLVIRHHASTEAIERTRKQNEALDRLGLAATRKRLRRFPSNPDTQKGNLAEIVLAEYVTSVAGLTLPVYRLRHNTNVEQSMKGDDVLAFDLDTTPPRILIGETKFRGTSATQAVQDIADALEQSYKAGVPASLQFVADKLFEQGNDDLGERVMNCVVLLAQNRLRLDHVGLLLSDRRAAERVNAATPSGLARLVMISMGVDTPLDLVTACFDGLE